MILCTRKKALTELSLNLWSRQLRAMLLHPLHKPTLTRYPGRRSPKTCLGLSTPLNAASAWTKFTSAKRSPNYPASIGSTTHVSLLG